MKFERQLELACERVIVMFLTHFGKQNLIFDQESEFSLENQHGDYNYQ